MRTNHFIVFGILAAFVVCCGTSATAQVVYGQPAAGDVGVIYTHWKVTQGDSEATINQFMIPLSGFVPIQDNLDITVFVANAGNSLKAGGSDLSMNGLSDVRLQVNHSLAGDQLLVSAGINLPTGKKKLTFEEEWVVLQMLSQDYLNLPSRRLGEGFGFNMLLGGATMLGDGVRGGASIMYQFAGSYEPYEGYKDYNPGDIISANAGVDFEVAPKTIVSADMIFTTYTDDKVGDLKTFRQSPQFDMRLGLRNANEALGYSAMVRYVLRGDNKQFSTEGLELSNLKLYGNELSLAGAVSWLFSGGWYVSPEIDARFIGGNKSTGTDGDFESSTVFGFGSSLGKDLGENLKATGGFKYYTGSADGGEIDVSGYQLTFGLTASM